MIKINFNIRFFKFILEKENYMCTPLLQKYLIWMEFMDHNLLNKSSIMSTHVTVQIRRQNTKSFSIQVAKSTSER